LAFYFHISLCGEFQKLKVLNLLYIKYLLSFKLAEQANHLRISDLFDENLSWQNFNLSQVF